VRVLDDVGSQARTFGQCLKLCPDDGRMHLGPVTRLRGESAIGSCDYIVGADKTREADKTFGDPLQMLDDIARMRDHAGNQDFTFGKTNPFP
jgi:hypothetical protein